jgi:hypothetical protein
LSLPDHSALTGDDRVIYDLYGVDNHYGGLGGGHCKYKHKLLFFSAIPWFTYF